MANLAGENLSKSGTSNLDFKNKIESTEKGIEKMAHDVGKSLGDSAAGMEKMAAGYLKNSREYVQENPAKSVAIAALAGAVAGGLLTIALKNRH